jgi:polyhydroxybutyrate depolymerase
MPTTIDVSGTTRTYTVVAPPSAGTARPLLLLFHGSRQDAKALRRFTGGTFDALAADGVVVASLDGYRGNWNDARRQSFFPARVRDVDDTGFARAVIAELVRTHGVDPSRVFAIGYSNGGQMAMRLLHEAPDLLAGAAVFSATMPTRDSFLFPDAPPAPRPVLLVHGTRDPIVPYRGGEMARWAQRAFRVGGTTLSAPETAAYFARRNGISAEPVTTAVAGSDRSTPATSGRSSRTPRTERTDYREAQHPPVRLLTVHGAGHTIPGPGNQPFILGRRARDVSAAAEVAAFFGLPQTAKPHPAGESTARR